ncbi:MAG: ABC transporter ATP-binding protein, partial [Acidocella sp. 20-61-6]
EIGGGLTDGEALELVEVILDLRRRRIAIVWIEHIVHILVRVVSRLVCMDAGRIIAEGEPQAVLQDPVVISAYLGSEAVS